MIVLNCTHRGDCCFELPRSCSYIIPCIYLNTRWNLSKQGAGRVCKRTRKGSHRAAWLQPRMSGCQFSCPLHDRVTTTALLLCQVMRQSMWRTSGGMATASCVRLPVPLPPLRVGAACAAPGCAICRSPATGCLITRALMSLLSSPPLTDLLSSHIGNSACSNTEHGWQFCVSQKGRRAEPLTGLFNQTKPLRCNAWSQGAHAGERKAEARGLPAVTTALYQDRHVAPRRRRLAALASICLWRVAPY